MKLNRILIAVAVGCVILAYAGYRHLVALWNRPETDQYSVIVPFHEPLGVASSADGRIIALAVADKPIQVLKPCEGNSFKSSGSPCPIARGLSFSGKTHLAAFPVRGSHVGTDIQLWDFDRPTSKGQKRLRAPKWCGQVLEFSHSGRILAGADPFGNAYIWDTKAGIRFRVLKGRGVPINCIAFSPDDTHLALADEKTKITVWAVGNPQNPAPLRIVGPSGFTCYALKFENPNQIRAVCYDQKIRTWDIRNGKRTQVAQLNDEGDDVSQAAFAANDSRVVSFQTYHFDISSYCISTEDYFSHVLTGSYRTRAIKNHRLLMSARGKHVLELSSAFKFPDDDSSMNENYDPYTTFVRVWKLGTASGSMHTVPVSEWTDQ